MEDLLDHAASMGLRVVWLDLGQRNGALYAGGVVAINSQKGTATQRVTLAHEIGHHWHGHDWTAAHDRERDERQADEYAARLLIEPAQYAAAERVVGSHPGALARELGVTVRLVERWRDGYMREVGVIRRAVPRQR